MDKEELIDRVTARTKGTMDHPLTRGVVEQVVTATLLELHADESDPPDEDQREV